VKRMKFETEMTVSRINKTSSSDSLPMCHPRAWRPQVARRIACAALLACIGISGPDRVLLPPRA